MQLLAAIEDAAWAQARDDIARSGDAHVCVTLTTGSGLVTRSSAILWRDHGLTIDLWHGLRWERTVVPREKIADVQTARLATAPGDGSVEVVLDRAIEDLVVRGEIQGVEASVTHALISIDDAVRLGDISFRSPTVLYADWEAVLHVAGMSSGSHRSLLELLRSNLTGRTDEWASVGVQSQDVVLLGFVTVILRCGEPACVDLGAGSDGGEWNVILLHEGKGVADHDAGLIDKGVLGILRRKFVEFPPLLLWEKICHPLRIYGQVVKGDMKVGSLEKNWYLRVLAIDSGPHEEQPKLGPVDVLLVCALKDEYDQVLAVSDGLLQSGWNQRVGPKGWTVADASFATSIGRPLLIRATWASHMGREQAQAVASALLQEQPARCLAMSGICAGRRGKVNLGDVIFADRLWSYDVGKIEKEDGKERFWGDTLQFDPAPVWVQRMQAVSVANDASWLAARPQLSLEQQEDWALLCLLVGDDPRLDKDFGSACPDWPTVLARLWKRAWLEKSLALTKAGREKASELKLLYPRGLPRQPEFKPHVGPLGTGAAVTEDDGIFPRLAMSMRKVLGVEMEASAISALGKMHGVPVVVAKGVSDYGDQFKDDRYRTFAARAAAECLISLLRGCADLLPERAAGGSSPNALD